MCVDPEDVVIRLRSYLFFFFSCFLVVTAEGPPDSDNSFLSPSHPILLETTKRIALLSCAT